MRRSLALLAPTIRALSLHVRFVRQSHNFRTPSAQNASVVAISVMGMHTFTHICSVECPEYGRGAHLAVGNGDSHAFLRRRALRMRAWRSSREWKGQQLRKFAMSGAQNAGVATIQVVGKPDRRADCATLASALVNRRALHVHVFPRVKRTSLN